ncbi:lamin tail domain-containing protein [Auritidibacter sp. NML100628]|uniref:lamin tail domain-containing protein n=1 Tax=Auritidibacter sp. NML100628 TaxID=2170742 RepID=UPI0013142AA4|nr:lamin tail domain-containing protein [Auritidibacter sp. NML100628]
MFSARKRVLATILLAPLTGAGLVLAPFTATAETLEQPSAEVAQSEVTVVINEVVSKGGDPGDWVEFYNYGTEDVDLSGYVLKDDDDSHSYVFPENTVIPAGGYLVIDEKTADNPGFDFGLGGKDQVRLFAPDGTTLVDSVSWDTHANGSYSRNADGDVVETANPTKGAANDFGSEDPAPGNDRSVVINEVVYDDIEGYEDSIELYNTSETEVDLTGYSVHDDKDRPGEGDLTGSLAPGEFLVLTKDKDFSFGLGKGDSVSLRDASGAEIDRLDYEATSPIANFSRCPDGTGEFQHGTKTTLGAPNNCEPVAEIPTPGELVLNEIDSSPADWLEFLNPGDEEIDISGVEIRDNSDDHRFRFPQDTTLGAGEYLIVDSKTTGEVYNDTADIWEEGTFEAAIGIGSGDSIRVYDAETGELTTEYSWSNHPAIDGDEQAATWARCPNATGPFGLGYATPGEANKCAQPAVVINEIESNGDATDWVEVSNVSESEVNISGWTLMDNDPIGHANDTTPLPEGTTLAPGELFVFDQGEHFDFGLGSDDTATIRDAAGNTVDEHSWTQHAEGVLARCDGELIDVPVSTKGQPNACGNPVVLNEVESSDADGGEDWIELYNPTAEKLDVSGLGVMDDKERDYTIAEGTIIEPESYLVIDNLDFGLGGDDEVRIFDGERLIQSTSWSSHAEQTWGRCPDATGEFANTQKPTPGAVNQCHGIPNVIEWPGDPNPRVIDEEPMFLTDSSGLDFADGHLWAVDNGTGIFWKLVAHQDGSVEYAEGWENGKRARFIQDADNPEAAGPDAEGITVDGDGMVYIASERDNSDKGTNYNTILQVDPNEPGPDVVASAQWDLTDLLPSVNANLGIEAVEWISNDAVKDKIVDLSQAEDGSVLYDPANHPNAIANGLFFTALENDGKLYAFVLEPEGKTTLVTVIDPQIGGAMGLHYDVDTDTLWVAADDGYQGTHAKVTFNGTDTPEVVHVQRPAGMENLNNEGFAISTMDYCVDGERPVWWFADGFESGSLRAGTLKCGAPDDEPTEEPTDEPTENPTGGPTDEPTEEPTEEPTDEPTENPTGGPTDDPTEEPTDEPTENPTGGPTDDPTEEPTDETTESDQPGQKQPEGDDSVPAAGQDGEDGSSQDGLAATGAVGIPLGVVGIVLLLLGAFMAIRQNRRMLN